ncbi:arsenate reductase ArsC [Halopseudomonas sp.]|uniref:arsenate reductase ArsC n=1 Tax=Halopseudomonas sp. TaxID=2901191 RepID=UPI0035633F1F
MLLNEDVKPLRLLVLCTGNSARSIIAEGLFNRDHIQAFSAGSQPAGRVNPLAMEQLSDWPAAEPPRSKSWDEFLVMDAVPLDIVLTVCGNAGHCCPQFPGTPERVHWGLPDPAAVEGTDELKRMAFSDCYSALKARIDTLVRYLREQPENRLAHNIAGFMRTLGPN